MKKKKPAARVVLPASLKTVPEGAKPAGKISPDERLEVTIRLRRKPGARTVKVEGKPLTREEFREAYGADPADIEKVEEFANEHGLDVAQSSIAQRSVRLSGTAKAMQAAFGVQFKAYRTAKTRQLFRGRTGTVSVPKDLANIVEAVFENLRHRRAPSRPPMVVQRQTNSPQAHSTGRRAAPAAEFLEASEAYRR